MKTIIDGETFNEEQARQILSGKAAIMTELEIARIKTDIAVRNFLTAEQKAQLEILKQRRASTEYAASDAELRRQ